MPSIHCKISLILTKSVNCVITNSTDTGTFAVTDKNCTFLRLLCQLSTIQMYRDNQIQV